MSQRIEGWESVRLDKGGDDHHFCGLRIFIGHEFFSFCGGDWAISFGDLIDITKHESFKGFVKSHHHHRSESDSDGRRYQKTKVFVSMVTLSVNNIDRCEEFLAELRKHFNDIDYKITNSFLSDEHWMSITEKSRSYWINHPHNTNNISIEDIRKTKQFILGCGGFSRSMLYMFHRLGHIDDEILDEIDPLRLTVPEPYT